MVHGYAVIFECYTNNSEAGNWSSLYNGLSVVTNDQCRSLDKVAAETDLKRKTFPGKTFKGKREDEEVCTEIPTSIQGRELSLEGIYRKNYDITSMSESQTISESDQMRNNEHRCGRKWVVLLASCLTLHIGTGFAYNMTVLNIAFLEAFGRSNAETSLVQSVTAGMFSIAGLPVGAAVEKYGVRKVGICGSLLAALGLILSFFATSIPYLVVAIGLITAVGLSACYIATLTGVGEYFQGKSKLEAFSFLSFGSGCGAITYPYLLNYLIGEIGWRGCLLVVGGMMLNLVPCFAVCAPITVGVSGPNQYDNNSIDRISVSTISSTSALYTRKDNGIYAKLKMLKNNKLFVINTFSLIILFPTMNSLVIFLINFLQFKGFDQQTAVLLYSVMTIFSTIFRLVSGVLKRIPYLSVFMIPALFTSAGTVACVLLPVAVTYEHHIVLLGILGMTIGVNATLISVTTMKLVGMECYSVGLGVTITGTGIGNVCGGPVAGYLTDITGSYTLSFYVASAVFASAACLNVLAATIQKYKTSHSTRQEDYLKSRRGHRRRSSVLPWKGKVEFIL